MDKETYNLNDIKNHAIRTEGREWNGMRALPPLTSVNSRWSANVWRIRIGWASVRHYIPGEPEQQTPIYATLVKGKFTHITYYMGGHSDVKSLNQLVNEYKARLDSPFAEVYRNPSNGQFDQTHGERRVSSLVWCYMLSANYVWSMPGLDFVAFWTPFKDACDILAKHKGLEAIHERVRVKTEYESAGLDQWDPAEAYGEFLSSPGTKRKASEMDDIKTELETLKADLQNLKSVNKRIKRGSEESKGSKDRRLSRPRRYWGTAEEFQAMIDEEDARIEEEERLNEENSVTEAAMKRATEAEKRATEAEKRATRAEDELALLRRIYRLG